MAVQIPKWETNLWSFISCGDGMQCPLINYCDVRRSGGWCPNDYMGKINRLLDSKRFHLQNYSIVPYGQCEHVFGLVEMLANRYFELGQVHSPPVPMELIYLFSKGKTIEVHTVPLKTCHGALWHLKNRWVIQLSTFDTTAMRRFILFHEAFHILAHYRANPVFRKRGASRGDFNEFLADVFASHLLLPEIWVKQKWTEYHDLNQMVKTFYVPKPVMCIRLRRMGLV